ncbi:MAG: helix-turn-helix transcriptional regulator [Pseudomonadota bacterium]
MNSKQLGLYLKKRREFLKLTQNDLSSKMNFKTPQFISNIERGVADIPAHRISDYAKVLDLDVRELSKMLADAMKNKIITRTDIKLGGADGKGCEDENDPFLVRFISAWHSASEEDRNNVRVLVSRFLNIK